MIRYATVAHSRPAFGGGEGTDRGGGVTCIGSTLSTKYVDFVYNTQKGFGAGAIFAENASVSVVHGVVQHNRNTARGAGAVFATGKAIVTFTRVNFYNNSISDEMGIGASGSRRQLGSSIAHKATVLVVTGLASVSLEACTVTKNDDATTIVVDSASVSIRHTVLEANLGCDVLVATSANVSVEFSIFDRNVGSAPVSLYGGTVATIKGALFRQNRGTIAGAISVSNTKLILQQTRFTSNTGQSPTGPISHRSSRRCYADRWCHISDRSQRRHRHWLHLRDQLCQIQVRRWRDLCNLVQRVVLWIDVSFEHC